MVTFVMSPPILMIKRIYRPVKVIKLKEARGYRFFMRYKSSFGGDATFQMDLFLVYEIGKQTESIHLEFKSLEPQLMVKEGIRLSVKSVRSHDREPVIKSLREFTRPVQMNAKDDLEFVMPIQSDKIESENDALWVKLSLVAKNKKEYLLVETKAKTPVVILGEQKIQMGE